MSTAAGAFYSQMESVAVQIDVCPLCVCLVQFQVPIQDQNRLRMSNWIWLVSRGQSCTGTQSGSFHSAVADICGNTGVYECLVTHLCSWTACVSVRVARRSMAHSAYQLVVESASPECPYSCL